MENKSFMVSEEIADQIDETQFIEESDEIHDVSEHIIVHLESEEKLIPGIIIKYDYRVAGTLGEEEITFSFLTENRNVLDFQRNMNAFTRAKLMLGAESIGEYSLEGMEVKRITVEQTPTQAGCVITVVYK